MLFTYPCMFVCMICIKFFAGIKKEICVGDVLPDQLILLVLGFTLLEWSVVL